MNLVRPTPACPAIKHSHNRMELVTEKVEKQSPAQRNSMDGFVQTGFEISSIRHCLE